MLIVEIGSAYVFDDFISVRDDSILSIFYLILRLS